MFLRDGSSVEGAAGLPAVRATDIDGALAIAGEGIKDILARPENCVCADCGAPKPRWAVTVKRTPKMGGFVCLACSGVHRALGVHISFVQSATIDTASWTDVTTALFAAWGNTRLNEQLEFHVPPKLFAQRPTPGSAREARERFIRAKYEAGAFVRDAAPRDDTGAPIRLPVAHWSAAEAAAEAAVDTDADADAGSGIERARAATAAKPLVGLLYLKAHWGRGLSARDVGGTSDPYIRAQVGAQDAKEPRQVRRATLNPSWDWHALVSWNGTDPLRLSVWDADGVLAGGADDFMGEALVDLRGLSPAPQSSPYVPEPSAVRVLRARLRPAGGEPRPWGELEVAASAAEAPPPAGPLTGSWRTRNSRRRPSYSAPRRPGCARLLLQGCARLCGAEPIHGHVCFSVAFMPIE
eukprot:g948.t1